MNIKAVAHDETAPTIARTRGQIQTSRGEEQMVPVDYTVLPCGTLRVQVLEPGARPLTTNIPPFFSDQCRSRELLDSLMPWVTRSGRPLSIHTEFANLRRLAKRITSLNMPSDPQTAQDWQNLIDGVYFREIVGEDERSTLDTRIIRWNTYHYSTFKYLQDVKKIIPPEIKFKKAETFNKGKNLKPGNSVLTDAPATSYEESSGDTLGLTKMLIDFDTSQTNVEYLDTYHDSLISARSALHEACLLYVTQLREHFDFGQRLLRMFPEKEAVKIIHKYRNYRELRECAPDEIGLPGETEISLARLLRFYKMFAGQTSLTKVFSNCEWLPSFGYHRITESAPKAVGSNRDFSIRFRWMLGHLAQRDLTAVHALLMLNLPRFTSDALISGSLQNGTKSSFSISVSGITLTVDKPRAGAKKTQTLNENSIFAFKLLRDLTLKNRKILESDQPALANRLFVLQDEFGIYAPARTSFYKDICKHEDDGTITFPAYPRLNGILRAPFLPEKIRATTIVLEWFRTGSVASASRLASNSSQIVLSNYIPQSLIDAWNRRLIRRFQNLWLVIASAGEDYQLAVTDFKSAQNMHAFINDMLKQHLPTSGELGAELHRRFQHVSGDGAELDSLDDIPEGSLIVPVSTETLSIIYRFRDQKYATGFDEDAVPSEGTSFLSVRAVVDLADLLYAKLPEHQDPRMRTAHFEAIERMPAYKAQASTITVEMTRHYAS